MAAGREKLYWSSVIIYGIVLVGVLLYLRFPADTFRRFCERGVERQLPGTQCSIGSIRLGFPPAVIFIDVNLRMEGDEAPLFEDGRLSVSPVLRNPLKEVQLQSSAYGGRHSARLLLENGLESIVVDDIDIEDLQLDAVPWLQRRLGREITGLLSGRGQAALGGKPFSLVAAKGELHVREGMLTLMRPILELDALALERSSVAFSLAEGSATIEDGVLENEKVKLNFDGRIGLGSPIAAGEMDLQGTLTPLPPLFEDNRQLRIIVTRMQKRYGNVALPFTVGGTVGRPTFVFTR